jgi:selenocysteine lyase/cysteine desulfurase
LLIGANTLVPLVQGGTTRYVNLDYAASTPVLRSVADAVWSLLPWYSSVHRGAGFKSILCSEAYESARETVSTFAGARTDDLVIFTRNTTDAINLLAHCLPRGVEVIYFASEHHANILPWRRQGIPLELPVPQSAAAALVALDAALARGDPSRYRLVTVTGASNVTGEVWPLAEIVSLAHRHGAEVLVDAAQLAPHRPLTMAAWGVDYLAFSAHKLYAPFGSGVLVGRPERLLRAPPYLAGGGAVEFVTSDDVLWKEDVERHEAGTPNVLGAVALAAACRELADRSVMAAAEATLLTYAREALLQVPGLTIYTTWDWADERIGVLTFNLAGMHHSLLASVLSAEYGIGTRAGCFCAHPLMLHLLKIDADQANIIRRSISQGVRALVPGAVRASFGLGTTHEDLRALVVALDAIAEDGPRWEYVQDSVSGEYKPLPDPRTSAATVTAFADLLHRGAAPRLGDQ